MSIVLLTVIAPIAQRTSADSSQTAAQAAAEIVSVQATADQVAGEWSLRDADAQRIAHEAAAAEVAVSEAASVVQATKAKVSTLAIDRYTSVVEPSLLPFADRGTARLERQTLSGFATDTSLDDLDRFQAAQRDLEQKQKVLDDTARENDAALARLTTTRQDLDAKLNRLQQLQTKLKDADIKREYEATLAALRAEQVAKAEAEARAAAQKPTELVPAARGDAPVPSRSRTSPDDGSRPALPAPAPPPETNPPVSPSSQLPASSAPAATPAQAAGVTSTPPTTSTPSTQVPPPVEPDRPAPPSGAAIDGLICPVNGANSFGDSWGAPRPGGKSHEGVDMMSPQGTPLVAAIDGFANMHTNRLGGNTVGLRASDGNYYYYAHLSAWEGPSRNVRQGEVIGYVGHTGETSADHLHFGIYVGGGTGPTINPYPIVRRIC